MAAINSVEKLYAENILYIIFNITQNIKVSVETEPYVYSSSIWVDLLLEVLVE
jgi:hypothetical protein